MYFSIIIPVYNRPEEVKELLDSLLLSDYKRNFEVVIVEDGSTIPCNEIVNKYSEQLQISYYFKSNSGPGDSRNFGMKKAKGDYFIIFDSDCIIPKQYLSEVEKELKANYVDCFGGPDAALKSFSTIQKAINFAMTSFLTTGGIRGGSEKIDKFQPRSFNMGISKKAFHDSNGFGNIHPGEDPDLSIRLWKLGYQTRLFSKCFVYHKRRIDWDKFTIQVSKFGKARPILNYWYPEYAKLTFWFPTFFILGLLVSILSLLVLFDWFLKLYFVYFLLIFITATIKTKNPLIGIFAIKAVWKQFFGYGTGFMISYFKINILKQKPERAFPELFFKKQIDTKIIGLTGGIGSGKSTVANYMQSLGIPVYISDEEARKVMEHSEVLKKIETNFSKTVFTDGKLDREKLAEVVFNQPEKLQLLNSIVHPAVKLHFDHWVNQHKENPILVKETAILFESGSYKDCSAIIGVIAPLEDRIERVIKRDNTTREKVIQRINNQLSDEALKEKCQYLIVNETIDETKKQVDKIVNLLKN